MSTRIPDTIMGVLEPRTSSSPTPSDVGGVILMPTDYLPIKCFCGICLAGIFDGATGKLIFCDLFDGENVLGEIEFTNGGVLISSVMLSATPTADENGFSCITFKLSCEGGGGGALAVVALAAVKVY